MADQSPAEVLREAARLMKKRAEGTSILWPGPWTVATEGDPPVPWVKSEKGGGVLATAPNSEAVYVGPAYLVPAEHIASWHPLVALAVADWLDLAAALYDAENFPYAEDPIVRRPLAVARAFLGTEGDSDE